MMCDKSFEAICLALIFILSAIFWLWAGELLIAGILFILGWSVVIGIWFDMKRGRR